MATAPSSLPPYSVTRRLTPADALAVQALVDRVTASRGHSPVDAGRLREVFDDPGGGFVGALAWGVDGATGSGTGSLVGYAQAVRGNDAWNLDVAVTDWNLDLAAALVRAVQGGATGEDEAPQRLWAFYADEHSERLAQALGMSAQREIRQLRCQLPLAREASSAELATRPFVVGQDEDAWLEVNSRAFAWHPEQGHMTLADLRAREQEPWFDPEGFRLHERGGELAGFCWTKVHGDAEPPLGEIYVIGVDPDLHGGGLGRGLTVAGLDHLARAGLTVGMLYVEATNEPALRLYETLGFELHHVDRVYAL